MVSDLATDVIVHIGEVRFYLHKVSVLVFSAIFAEVNTKHLYLLLQITAKGGGSRYVLHPGARSSSDIECSTVGVSLSCHQE